MDKKVYEFISQQTGDPIIERRTCILTGEKFAWFQSDEELLQKFSYRLEDRVITLPRPDYSPRVRLLQQLQRRNERKLYKNTCYGTGKPIISNYSPESGYKVFDIDYRRSDAWNAMDYGRDFDFSRSFFAQFSDLMHDVPHFALHITGNSHKLNSKYINFAGGAGGSKNCYLIFNSGDCEDCAYIRGAKNNKDCFDVYFGVDNERCYDIVNCQKSFELLFSAHCVNCSQSYYLLNCENCNHCFGCVGLVNKQYCLFNTQLDKEKYLLEVQKYKKDIKNTDLQSYIRKIHQSKPLPSCHTLQSENISGDLIFHTKNCQQCFEIDNSENCKYCNSFKSSDNCMDCFGYGYDSSLLYQNVGTGGHSHHCVCTSSCETCEYNRYCFENKNCQHCFGCVGFRNKKYCISNKQYDKESYEQLVLKIVEKMKDDGERGQYLPTWMSPFPYNDTVAQDYFPLSVNDVSLSIESHETKFSPALLSWGKNDKMPIIRRNYEEEVNVSKNMQILSVSDIPSIDTVTDDILQQAIVCEVSGRPFRIVAHELQFYRDFQLPLPTKHPDVRHRERIKKYIHKDLHLRTCDKCGVEMLSVYESSKLEAGSRSTAGESDKQKVYCEKCYQKEIYG